MKLDSPPPPTMSPGGGGGGWVDLARAENDIDAHLLVGRLTGAGIEARTVPDRAAPGAWLLGGSNPWAPVTILVRRWQLEDARLVLAEISFDAPAAQVDGEPGARGTKPVPIVWWATALALGVFFSVVALTEAARAIGPCPLPVVCDDPTVTRR
jgi:Putative prokaryotic signal transducing protein